MKDPGDDRDVFDDFGELDEEADFSEAETQAEEEHDSEDFGDFAEHIREIEEHNDRRREYAREELTSTSAKCFLDKELVDVEAIKSEIREFLSYQKAQRQKMSGMSQDSAVAWQVEEDINRRERQLHHKCSLLSVGLTPSDLGGIAADLRDVIYAAGARNSDSVFELRQRMKSLTSTEKRQLIDELRRQGRINDAQARSLRSEYL